MQYGSLQFASSVLIHDITQILRLELTKIFVDDCHQLRDYKNSLYACIRKVSSRLIFEYLIMIYLWRVPDLFLSKRILLYSYRVQKHRSETGEASEFHVAGDGIYENTLLILLYTNKDKIILCMELCCVQAFPLPKKI